MSMFQKFWQKFFVDSIQPEEPTHTVEMQVNIRKGQKKGEALIPCAIYTLNHAIDLNPSLIKKKTGKKIKDLPLSKKFEYNPSTEELILQQDEQLQYEEERACPHCGQKTVIAEVCTTRYRSCPKIEIELSTEASEDAKIPVSFGVREKEIKRAIRAPFTLLAIFSFLGLFMFFPMQTNSIIASIANPIPFLSEITQVVGAGFLILSLAFLGYLLTLSFYKSFKLWQWYSRVKHTLKEVKQ